MIVLDSSNFMRENSMRYKHVFGAMDKDSARRIAYYILEANFDLAHYILKQSTGWKFSRTKSFIDRYRQTACEYGTSNASVLFLKENFIIEEFLTVDEMEI